MFWHLKEDYMTTTEREIELTPSFLRSEEHDFVDCCDITGLLTKLGIQTDVRKDWWLFIDGSVSSVKAVLLHVENTLPAIPVGYTRQAK